MAFKKEMEKTLEDYERAITNVIKKRVVEGCSEIVFENPIDTGLMKFNWQLGLNYAPEGTLEMSSERMNMMEAYMASSERIADAMKKFKLGDEIHFVNNVRYAVYVEGIIEGRGVQKNTFFISRGIKKLEKMLEKDLKGMGNNPSSFGSEISGYKYEGF